MPRLLVQFTGTLSFEVSDDTLASEYGEESMERAINEVIINDLRKDKGTFPESDVVVEGISLYEEDDCYDDDDSWEYIDDYWDEDEDEDWEEIEEIEEV